MSTVEVPMYYLTCDHDGCGAVSTEGTDYFAWSDFGQAADQAGECEWDVNGDADYCPEHARPVCEECGTHASDTEPDADGDLWCGECRAAADENGARS